MRLPTVTDSLEAYYRNTPSPTERDLILLGILAAFLAHQAFRLHETHSILTHVALIIGPPILIAFGVCSGEMELWSVAEAFPLAFTVYAIALPSFIVLYRLSPFHPLARYPGPILCKITGFWMAYIALPGYQREYIKRLHEKHGDIVRIGPNSLSICDPTVLPSLLGVPGVPKGPHFQGRLLSEHISLTVAIQDPDEHMRRRRAWARGFTPNAVKDYEEQITTRLRQLLSRLDEQKGGVRLDNWFSYFTLDFLSDIAFGGGSELLNSREKKNFWSVLEESFSFATFRGHVPWLGVYLGRLPFFKASIKDMMSHCRTLAKKRIERGPVKRDLFYHLNHEDAADSERVSPPIHQVVDDGILAIVAGADTVASVLTSLFGCLLAYPEVLEKLQAEVDRYCPSPEDALDPKRHREMRYLEAVINETLRFFAPVPLCTQRQVPRGGAGVMAGSAYIPPGTTFWVHAWSMHRDARNFYPAPAGFWPERWLYAAGLGADALAQRKDADAPQYHPATFVHNEAAFVPFSLGPMNCVGKNLGLQETRMVVCALLQRFSVRPSGKWELSEYEKEYRDYFVTTRPRVPVVLEARQRPSV